MVALHYPTQVLAHPSRRAPRLPVPRSGRHAAPGVYRRRRLGVAVLFLGALLGGGEALGALGGGPLTASEAGSDGGRPIVLRPVSRTSHVVAPGETLWSIVRQLQPVGDIRPLVDSIAARRGGRPLQVGERIELPAGPPGR
ncbi:MAG: hypothetical protein KY458_07015 [Actinobacteria bacterium]|nr:hypothetical protein [Actinomycetota bacterium]